MKRKSYLEEIDVLKGIAIIGVVIYHMQLPLVNPYISNLLIKHLFSYSMPIFALASGFLFGFDRVEMDSFSGYLTFVSKKFKRLMVPYFMISAIILFLKLCAGMFFTLNFPVDRNFWKYLLFNPLEGFAAFLWFLYILFFIFLLFPIINKFIRNRLLLFFIIMVMNFIPFPQTFYFNHVLFREFLIFFYLGCLYSSFNNEYIKLHSSHYCILSLGLLVLLSIQKETVTGLLNIIFSNQIADRLSDYLIFISGTQVYYFISVLIKKKFNPLFSLLKYIGLFSSPIYLLHSVSMGATKVIFINFLNPNISLYSSISILLFISGIVLPILITKYIINRFEVLPPLILGVKGGA